MTKEQIQEFTRRISQENHSGLILVLCDMEHVYIHDALAAFEQGDLDVYLKNAELAKQCMHELITCFSPQDKLGRQVISIFRFLYGKLVRSVVQRKPDELDRCASMVDNLRVGFEHLHTLDKEDPVMQNTHQVYAGLTYGKGTLQESVQGVDFERRGYQV